MDAWKFWSLGWGGGFAAILCFLQRRMEGFFANVSMGSCLKNPSITGYCNHTPPLHPKRDDHNRSQIFPKLLPDAVLYSTVFDYKLLVFLLLLLCVIMRDCSTTIIMIVINYFDSDLWVWWCPTQRRTWTIRKLDRFFGMRKLTAPSKIEMGRGCRFHFRPGFAGSLCKRHCRFCLVPGASCESFGKSK